MYEGLKDRLNDLSEFFTRHDMPMSAMTIQEAIKALENESDAIQIKDHEINRLNALVESQQRTIDAAVSDMEELGQSLCESGFGESCSYCEYNTAECQDAGFKWKGVQNG